MGFEMLQETELNSVNGGGVGGMIVGCFLGATVGLIAGPIAAVVTNDLDEGQKIFYGCFLTGGSVGFVLGPA